MRTIGSPKELERRRIRAIELLQQGEKPKMICRFFKVTPKTVSVWKKLARNGLENLLAKKIPGRKPRLSVEQLSELKEMLLKGAMAHGWPNDLWTANRVKALVLKELKISFHPEHLRKILRWKMNWTSQKPEKQSRERDPEEVENWKTKEFPRIKKKQKD